MLLTPFADLKLKARKKRKPKSAMKICITLQHLQPFLLLRPLLLQIDATEVTNIVTLTK